MIVNAVHNEVGPITIDIPTRITKDLVKVVPIGSRLIGFDHTGQYMDRRMFPITVYKQVVSFAPYRGRLSG